MFRVFSIVMPITAEAMPTIKISHLPRKMSPIALKNSLADSRKLSVMKAIRFASNVIVLLMACSALSASPSQDEGGNAANTPSKWHQSVIQPTKKSGTGMMPMPLVAPLFIEDANTESEITMVNNSSSALDVEITLTNLSGAQLSNTTISMAPHAQTVAKIAELLSTASQDSAETLGSVMLMANRNASLAAQLSIITHGQFQTDDIEEEFVMMMDPKPASYRGVAGNISGSSAIAIRSLSSSAQTVSVICVRGKGALPFSNELQIAPNQTLLIRACGESGRDEIRAARESANIRQAHSN